MPVAPYRIGGRHRSAVHPPHSTRSPDHWIPGAGTRIDRCGLRPPIKCYGFPDEPFAYFQNSGLVNAFELALRRQFGNSLFYLGPLRQYPARPYPWQGSTPSRVGAEGERAIEALLASGRRPRKERIARELKSNGHAKKLFLVEDVVSQWLREMELARSFYVERVAEDADIYRVRIKRSSDSAEVLLPDVGFGASQVLPVLVLLACVPKTSVVILEQPELHLHPAVQAALADAILETARVGRAQVIVESHSEYLLSRLQRRVAEGTVSKEDIALYFCDHDDRRSSIERLDSNDRKFVAATVWSGHGRYRTGQRCRLRLLPPPERLEGGGCLGE